MKFELIPPEPQSGRLTQGTKVLIDGQELRHVKAVELLVHADDIIRLTIRQLATNENDRFYIIGEGEEQQLATITRVFFGSFTLTGEIEELQELTEEGLSDGNSI